MNTENQDNSGAAHRALLCLFAALVMVAVPIAMVWAADVTPGYTFSSGEANVTHTKLNNATSGNINSTFYSGKSSAGVNPTPGNYTMIGLDSVTGTFKRQTLDQWVFDHEALLSARTVVTSPAVGYTFLINDGGAYKQLSTTNLLYGGGDATPSGDMRFGGVLASGSISSITLSNLFALLTSHSLPTNGDLLMTLIEGGRAVKVVSLENLFKGPTAGTNFDGDHIIVSWDGTRLRGNRGTNLIDGVTVTNTAPSTNAAFLVLENGQLRKTFGAPWRELMQKDSVSITQTVYTIATNINPGGAWTTVTNLVASITPRSTSSKVLVRVVMTACAAGNSQPGMMRGLRTTGGDVPLGVGFDDGLTRTEASSPIVNSQEPASTVFEYLDSPAYASNTIYTVQVYATASTTVYINRTSADSVSANSIRGVSSITLTEIYK